ncbi:MAG: hypothetical protein A3J55_01910 [Candidatus Ryanbacteria bacterium RIFCSPHIGHO2_02_FULL_45_17b]|uniref:ROK family protein n=1 Tax=Candidatus Ryanbacteria bacterium RIFCSPHIGHO2_01_FULL_45_22 TaxID=1802114 RepID=A0A1G2G3Q6_9BACT|nr:MAG: hypothetical protein A2719_04155 [Candidatus Ryanbacteria bacterium RIFCSPHIGHO2_01_FULL_45_22]OGZ47655.1 MAG: hypothetical protein A3J55_01910 [Candidatus Ryanbacteria bacterium RIFCSPHIGHO2_02_FULL_45_17b]
MFLLFDIGGTHMRFAVSKDGKELGELKIIPTPKDNFEEGMRIIQETARELLGEEKIEAVVGGLAGTLNKERAVFSRAPHMRGWIEKPLKKELEMLFHVPVYLENDAALAGLGEAVRGAGQSYGIVAYGTVSTGVGGARVVDGRIDRNTGGFEPGHQIINYDGEARTLEECVSGSALLRRFAKKPEDITDPELWEEMARLLTQGIHNTILHWAPDVLVLGGPIILRSPFPFENFKKQLSESVLQVLPIVPEIKKAELGDMSGLHGALIYAQHLL